MAPGASLNEGLQASIWKIIAQAEFTPQLTVTGDFSYPITILVDCIDKNLYLLFVNIIWGAACPAFRGQRLLSSG